jgi:hypothetical protein
MKDSGQGQERICTISGMHAIMKLLTQHKKKKKKKQFNVREKFHGLSIDSSEVSSNQTKPK